MDEELREIEPDEKSPKSAKRKGMLVICNMYCKFLLCLLVVALHDVGQVISV